MPKCPPNSGILERRTTQIVVRFLRVFTTDQTNLIAVFPSIRLFKIATTRTETNCNFIIVHALAIQLKKLQQQRSKIFQILNPVPRIEFGYTKTLADLLKHRNNEGQTQVRTNPTPVRLIQPTLIQKELDHKRNWTKGRHLRNQPTNHTPRLRTTLFIKTNIHRIRTTLQPKLDNRNLGKRNHFHVLHHLTLAKIITQTTNRIGWNIQQNHINITRRDAQVIRHTTKNLYSSIRVKLRNQTLHLCHIFISAFLFTRSLTNKLAKPQNLIMQQQRTPRSNLIRNTRKPWHTGTTTTCFHNTTTRYLPRIKLDN
mmetsp:Transcript_13861/g.22627  ORF Transcript_13861/g.22627 Transcript_13861/m.22627 type:complete len:312 (-) Transcript_13861:854-1789(-)